MDYLDPKKKKMKRARIMIGYALMGIAISITTVVVVYLVNGYYVDTETGEVIQNGLVYVDSKPESAQVFLNGEQQRGSTDARLVVPAGEYKIELKRDGYRNWERNIRLEGGKLRQITYARLVPVTLDSENALDLPSSPTMVTQSNDKRWLVMAFTDDPLTMQYVDLERPELTMSRIPIPLDLIITKDAGVWETIEWADDNKTFLATYTTAKTTEYVLIDRDDPTKSVNLASAFPTQGFTDISMRNRKKDLVFVHDKASGAIFRGNVNSGELEPYMNDVIDYVAFGNDAVLYVTKTGAKDGLVKALLKKGDDEYMLREIAEDNNYLLEISKQGSALVMGVGSTAEGRVIVYDDPIAAIKNNEFSKIPVPTTVLRVDSPQDLSISADSSVIVVRSGQSFASYEFEAERSYNFKFKPVIDDKQKIRWLDGQHLTISAEGVQYMSDFDGSNQYKLVKSASLLGSYFDRNTDLMYTFAPKTSDTVPARIVRTFMRSANDR